MPRRFFIVGILILSGFWQYEPYFVDVGKSGEVIERDLSDKCGFALIGRDLKAGCL